MGLFDFLKPKKNLTKKVLRDFQFKMKSAFPNGNKDVDAAANELQQILNNGISHEEAKGIIRKSVGIRLISNDRTKERLIQHLAGYCIHYFTDSQLEEFHNYLNVLDNMMILKGAAPSEITRDGNRYL